MPLISLQNLTKIYRLGGIAIPALKEVNLTIAQGEFVAVMGASGSGKSTLMSILGCLDSPTTGSYCLDGVEVARMDEEELTAYRCRKVGFIFRATAAKGAPEGRGLFDSYPRPSDCLSGGQLQLMAIARALMNDPAVVIADEPTGGLDTRTSCDILAVLQQLHRRGRTIVLATEVDYVARHADRILRFQDGQVAADQTMVRPVAPEVRLRERCLDSERREAIFVAE